MTVDELAGVWRLVEYHELDEAGGAGEGPLGPAPEGLLIYDRDGWVSVSMMRGLADPPADENFMGYTGRWRLEGDQVVHEVLVSAHPGQVNTAQVRDVVLDGDDLTLSGTPLRGEGRRRLRWRKVRA